MPMTKSNANGIMDRAKAMRDKRMAGKAGGPPGKPPKMMRPPMGIQTKPRPKPGAPMERMDTPGGGRRMMGTPGPQVRQPMEGGGPAVIDSRAPSAPMGMGPGGPQVRPQRVPLPPRVQADVDSGAMDYEGALQRVIQNRPGYLGRVNGGPSQIAPVLPGGGDIRSAIADEQPVNMGRPDRAMPMPKPNPQGYGPELGAAEQMLQGPGQIAVGDQAQAYRDAMGGAGATDPNMGMDFGRDVREMNFADMLRSLASDPRFAGMFGRGGGGMF